MRIALPLLLATFVSACVQEKGPEPELPPLDPNVVQRTVVILNGDGLPSVTTTEITRAEQQAELAQRAELMRGGPAKNAIDVDTSCGSASLWLFDNVNQTGNEICFYGSGTAALDNYIRYCRRNPWAIQCYWWNRSVRSYWAGAETGRLCSYIAFDADPPPDPPPPGAPPPDAHVPDQCTNFSSWQRVDTAYFPASDANYVTLY